MRDKHYLNLLNWVKSYVPNQEEAEGLTNQLHYISIKYSRSAVAAGILVGWISMALILFWIG